MSAKKKAMLRLGLFGGTFDPVHNGHLLQARDAIEQARLDALLFIPCRQSPHKGRVPLASEKQRLTLLKLATKCEPRFWVSACEMERPAPSYTIDTVTEIAAAFPLARLFWLIGADQVHGLPTWHRYDELRKAVTFLLLQRRDPILSIPEGEVLGLPRPRRIDISATEIRYRIKKRLPVDFLVPASTLPYLHRQRLYLTP